MVHDLRDRRLAIAEGAVIVVTGDHILTCSYPSSPAISVNVRIKGGKPNRS
jgi:hypothetical protein